MVKKILRPRNSIRGTISVSEIKAVYGKAFIIPAPGLLKRITLAWFGVALTTPFHIADSYYEPANEDLIRQIIIENEADKAQYISEKKDCDNFTFALMGALRGVDDRTCGMPIFITWVLPPEPPGHALLSYYINGQAKLIEPQTDRIYSPPTGWQLILCCG